MLEQVLPNTGGESTVEKSRLTRGFIFACTNKTEGECFDRLLFGTSRVYAPIVIRVRAGDLLFLNNIEKNVLYGVFRAVSKGDLDIQPNAWGGRYPFQVKVEILGERVTIENATKTLKKLGIKRSTPLFKERLLDFLDLFVQPTLLGMTSKPPAHTKQLIVAEKNRIQKETGEIDIEEEVPIIEATTLWDFPKQSYGLTPKGDNKYPGVTPALIIYNLIWRYTKPHDVVVDPMCGSGTTIDVCKQENRRVIGLDISPVRSDIIQSDARYLPLENDSADMVFIDSPYGDNIRYNEHKGCIGKISSETGQFYDELEKVMIEAKRIMKEGKVLGWLIGDQWVRKKFTPVGLKVFERLCQHFQPMDIICVTRRGQSSHTGSWYNRARRLNFFLRGFKHLLIVRKVEKHLVSHKEPRRIEWRAYTRKKSSKENDSHNSAKSSANSATDKIPSSEP